MIAPTRPPAAVKSGRPSRQLRPSFQNPSNPVDELLLRPFIASCVNQLGGITSKRIMMLRSLIPVVTDCLVSVAHSYKEGVGHDATTMNTKLAQALFRKNPEV